MYSQLEPIHREFAEFIFQRCLGSNALSKMPKTCSFSTTIPISKSVPAAWLILWLHFAFCTDFSMRMPSNSFSMEVWTNLGSIFLKIANSNDLEGISITKSEDEAIEVIKDIGFKTFSGKMIRIPFGYLTCSSSMKWSRSSSFKTTDASGVEDSSPVCHAARIWFSSKYWGRWPQDLNQRVRHA